MIQIKNTAPVNDIAKTNCQDWPVNTVSFHFALILN